MKYWLDTEFYEDGKTIDLISIGIVAEDGRELYLESSECDSSRFSDWVKDNVVRHLSGCSISRAQMKESILEFIRGDEKPEFWAYYAAYDWVVFCQLFGTMMDLPKGWPMYCRDIKQLCDDLGNPNLPKQEGQSHNALADARWNREAFNFLNKEVAIAMTTTTYSGEVTDKKKVMYMVRVPLVRTQAVKDLAKECRAEHIETEEYELHKDVTFGFDSLDACKIFRNRYDQLMRNFPPDVLSPSEAVYGLAAWLSGQPLLIEDVRQFCEINNLPKPRHGWQSNLRLS